eukprot:11016084-Alexandrium_andersonii.AAC.1
MKCVIQLPHHRGIWTCAPLHPASGQTGETRQCCSPHDRTPKRDLARKRMTGRPGRLSGATRTRITSPRRWSMQELVACNA